MNYIIYLFIDNCSQPEQFQCNNLKCIHDWQRCNGVNDCGDDSDEDLDDCKNTESV